MGVVFLYVTSKNSPKNFSKEVTISSPFYPPGNKWPVTTQTYDTNFGNISRTLVRTRLQLCTLFRWNSPSPPWTSDGTDFVTLLFTGIPNLIQKIMGFGFKRIDYVFHSTPPKSQHGILRWHRSPVTDFGWFHRVRLHVFSKIDWTRRKDR